jgi:hypothetical protein
MDEYISILTLLDHLVRSLQDPLRNRQADLLCGLHVDYQLKLRRLLDGRSAGFAPLRILST